MRALRKAIVAVAAVSAVTALGGCGSDSTTASSAQSSSSVAPAPTVARDEAIAASVPAAIRSAGTLTVAVNVPYEPNEFLDGSGRLVGFDIDLMNAVGTVMGLKPEYRRTKFTPLMAGVRSGRYDLAASSITDTTEREKTMDFVTYFNAGVSWASRAGHEVDPDDACGKRVVVKDDTVAQRVDLSARSRSCVANGHKAITVVSVGDQDEVVSTLKAGRADAMAADSPIAAYEVKRSGGALVLAPGIFGSQPYGIAFKKNSALVEPVRAAVQSLIDSGAYQSIVAKWGLDNGTVPNALINGAFGES